LTYFFGSKIFPQRISRTHTLFVGARRNLATLGTIANRNSCEFWSWGKMHRT